MTLDYLTRYQNGEYSAWDELVELAPDVISNPQLHAQTIAVAEALMGRVRSNADALRNALTAAGASIGELGTPLTAADLQWLVDEYDETR